MKAAGIVPVSERRKAAIETVSAGGEDQAGFIFTRMAAGRGPGGSE